jgi:hypothetical protein
VEWPLIVYAGVDVGDINSIGLFFLAECWKKSLNIISN